MATSLKQQTVSGVKWSTLTHWTGFLLKKLIRREKTCPILAYHRITADETGDKHSVSVADFVEQMDYFYKRGFRTISLNHNNIQKNNFILTFDDGFEDFCTNALPILKKYNFMATIFVVAGLVGKESEWEKKHGGQPGRLMGWAQIKDIMGQGLEIGSHTMTHADLTKLSEDDLNYEIGESKRLLEAKTGRKVEFLSYPYGKFTEKVKEIAKNSDYLGTLTTTEQVYNDNFTLGRIYINNGDSASKLHSKMRLVAG